MSENRRINMDSEARRDKEKRVLAWIVAVNESRMSGLTTYQKLKDGIALCKLINRLQPGSISQISTSQMAFKQRENMYNFLKSLQRYGVADANQFKPSDLDSNMAKVIDVIESIAMLAKKKGFKGPVYSNKPKQRKHVSFSDEDYYIH